jgi:hypothetical protein
MPSSLADHLHEHGVKCCPAADKRVNATHVIFASTRFPSLPIRQPVETMGLMASFLVICALN